MGPAPACGIQRDEALYGTTTHGFVRPGRDEELGHPSPRPFAVPTWAPVALEIACGPRRALSIRYGPGVARKTVTRKPSGELGSSNVATNTSSPAESPNQSVALRFGLLLHSPQLPIDQGEGNAQSVHVYPEGNYHLF
jgi:hypothetical protein